ncbi:MAG: carboxypeptidase regulatory-like domain-containing protein [Acidobacteria bacterium]|nr:carboxypeptidase regulatory-like domain-containing protein [Acidobacteriota bacterium]
MNLRKIVGLGILLSALTALSFSAAAQTCSNVPPGIAAWYRAENNADDSAFISHGAYQNGGTYVAGIGGRAFSLDGTDDFVAVPGSPALNVGAENGLTIEGWISPVSIASQQPLVEWNNGGAAGVHVWHSVTFAGGSLGNLFVNLVDTSGGNHIIQTPAVLATNVFQHFAVTYDKTTGTAKIFVNGLEAASAILGVFTPQTGPAYNLYFGTRPSSGLFFQGSADEISVYRAALDQSSIQTIVNAGTAGKCPKYRVPAPVGLVSWYAAENNALDARSRRNGTPQNGATYAGGKVGQAFSFDGLDDSIDLGPGFSDTGFTVSLWLNPGATQVDYADIMDNNHAGGSNWVIQQDFNITNQYNYRGQIFTLTPNVWQHLVVSQSSSGNFSIYVNGAPVGGGNAPVSFDGNQFLRLGRWGGGGRNWNGRMDEFAYFDRPLSASEAQAIFNADFAGMSKPAATAPPSGQVAWLTGDGDGLDLSRHGNNALAQNGAKFSVDKVGQGFVFDGVDDRLLIRASESLNVGAGNGFTVEGWVNPASSTAQQPIWEWNSGGPAAGNIGANLWMSDQSNGGVLGNLFANIRDTSGNNHFLETPTSVMTANTFQHVVVTYDKTTGEARIFRNGATVASGNLGIFTPQTGFDLYFGNRPASLSFGGMMDEFSVYDRVLTEAEIASIYGAGIGGKLKSSVAATNYLESAVAVYHAENNGDDSIGANDGTPNNGATFGAGRFEQGFDFDGIDDEVAVPDAPGINFGANHPMSVELWAYRTSTNVLQHLIGKRNNCDGSPINFQIVYASGQTYFGAGFGNEVASGQDLPLNTWTHIAGTFDGAVFRIYINGVLAGSASGALGQTTAQMLIGGSGTCAKFGGRIDEASIYKRALTASEVSSIYALGIASVWSAENNANDSTGRNNGVLQNGVGFKPGKFGGHFDFDGVNDYVSVPDSPSVRPASALTAAGWFKFDSIGSGVANHLISKPLGSTFGNSYVIWIQDGRIWIKVGDSPTGGTFTDTGYAVQTGVWYHIAMTFDDAADSLKCFVNGVEVASVATNVTILYDNHPMLIGGEITNESLSFLHDGQADEVTLYSRALTASEIQAIILTEKIGDATVTLPNLSTAGVQQEIPVDPGSLPPLPPGATPVGLNYDIATSGAFSGNADICFNLPSFDNPTQFANLRVLHLEGSSWINRTLSANFPARTLCARTPSLSPFAIIELAPTAAELSLAGRVRTVEGRGIANASISVMNTRTGETRLARTGSFGYYSFDGLEASETYVITVASKRFSFAPASRVVTLKDSLTDEDFVADSGGNPKPPASIKTDK